MNRFTNKITAFLLIALSLSVSANVLTSQAAFGASPPWIKNDHLPLGSVYKQIIYLSQSESDNAMKVAARISGDEELIEWVSITDAENLIIEEGKTTFPIEVVVSVPKNAELKRYLGSIFVTAAPVSMNKLNGGEVGINLGANIVLDLTVTGEKVVSYEASLIPPVESHEEGEPLSVNVEVKNTGNTEITELEGGINIYGSNNSSVIKTLPFLPLEEPIAFNETKRIQMTYEDYVPVSGKYWVALKTPDKKEIDYAGHYLYKVGKEEIRSVDSASVETPARVTAPETAMLSDAETPENVNYIYYILGLLILTATAVLLYILRL